MRFDAPGARAGKALRYRLSILNVRPVELEHGYLHDEDGVRHTKSP